MQPDQKSSLSRGSTFSAFLLVLRSRRSATDVKTRLQSKWNAFWPVWTHCGSCPVTRPGSSNRCRTQPADLQSSARSMSSSTPTLRRSTKWATPASNWATRSLNSHRAKLSRCSPHAITTSQRCVSPVSLKLRVSLFHLLFTYNEWTVWKDTWTLQVVTDAILKKRRNILMFRYQHFHQKFHFLFHGIQSFASLSRNSEEGASVFCRVFYIVFLHIPKQITVMSDCQLFWKLLGPTEAMR